MRLPQFPCTPFTVAFLFASALVGIGLAQAPRHNPEIPPVAKRDRPKITQQEKDTEKGNTKAAEELLGTDRKAEIEQGASTDTKEDIDRRLAQFTFLLVVVGALQLFALLFQARVLSHHSTLIERSVEQMRQAVTAYEKYVGIGEQTLTLTKESNDITRQATELTQQSLILMQRPRLVVRDVLVDDPQRLMSYRGIPGGPSDGPLTGNALVANVGTTDAFLVEEFNEVLYLHPDEPLLFGDNRFNVKSIDQVRLPPGMNTRMCSFSSPEGQRPPFEDIYYGNLELFLIGWVGYRDRLGNYRRTSYCRKWDRKVLRFTGTSDADYENAD